MNPALILRASCVWAITAVVLVMISSESPGQGRKGLGSDFAAGDRVEVRQGNKWQAGEVVETRGGLVKVQVTGTPTGRVISVPKQLVRRAEVAASTPAANSPPAQQLLPGVRVWTDSTGQYKVEAEFVEAADGKVTLRKKDGSLAVLPLERLCEEDQGLIASLADDGGDASPEDVLRQFLVALAGGNRRQVAALMLPHPNAAVLFQGESAPPQVVAQIEKQLAGEEIRQLKSGEVVSLPSGGTMSVGADHVNADQVLLQIPNHPLPYSVVRRKNGWRVDATPIIQARRTAQAMRDGAGTGTRETGDEETISVQLGDWQTITAMEGRVSIQLPGKATKAEQVSQIAEGPVTFVVYKYAARGRFWNLNVVTYPAELIEASTDKVAFLTRIGNGVMRGKAGSEQISLATLKKSSYPAIRLEYRYPLGKNSAGEYGSGQATHELYLIGNQVCWAFVDVLDVAREAENDKVTAEIKRFFASLVLPKE